MERRIALDTELIEQPWVRALFQEFCAWDGLPRTAGDMVRRIDAYAICFAAIDRHCTAPALLGQGLLLRVLGAEGLRRQHLAVRFLAGRLGLDWKPERVEAFTESARADALLSAAASQPWGSVVSAYRDHLALDTALRPRTVRSYLNAAVGLMASSGRRDLAGLEQGDLDRYLGRRPGQGASLARFVSYAAQAAQVRLALPGKPEAAAPKARETALLRQVQALLDWLDQAKSAGEGRALLAAALSRLYQVPLLRMLAIKLSEVEADEAGVVLWPAGLALRLAPPMEQGFRRWAPKAGTYVFPGRNHLQPLSPEAVRYHVEPPTATVAALPEVPAALTPGLQHAVIEAARTLSDVGMPLPTGISR